MPGTFDEIYDFETAIEGAFETFCTEQSMAAITSNTAPEFQKERPRFEFVLQVSGEAGHNSPIDPYIRPDSFTGTLTGALITPATPSDGDGPSLHALYRARFRNIMATARRLLNTTRAGLIPWHSIEDIVLGSASPQYKSEDGYYMTQTTFQIKWNIRPAAWPEEIEE